MRNTRRAVLTAAAAAAIGLLAGACESSGSGNAAAGAGASSTGTPAATSPSPSAASGQSSAPTGPTTAPASTPTASATNYPVDLQPQTAAPGSHVMVYGLTCSSATGTASSTAFSGPVALSMISNATGGDATVKPGLAAGQYPVTVTCGSVTVTGTLTVS